MQLGASVQISMELWGAIFCIIFAAFIFIGEDQKTRRGNLLTLFLFLICLILLSDSFAWAYRGGEGTVAYYAVRISNFLVFSLNYAIGYTALKYLEELLHMSGRKLNPVMKYLITGICVLGFSIVTISQFTGFLYTFDEHNLYHRADGYLVISIVAGLMVLMMIAVTCTHSRGIWRQTVPLLLVFLLALVATVIQLLFYGISLVNIGMVAGVLVMFFAYEKDRIAVSSERKAQLLEKSLQLSQHETALAQKDAEMATINMQLVEQRTQIMLSQIKPHFLYNALSAISSLCLRNPMKAKETIDNFALYLRANLNSLNHDHMIPFEQELQHTKAYLAIEQTRFGEDLTLEYDIQCEDFMLPSLSVQPIAENAVRHGICGNEDGGTVRIRTERKDGNVVITVSDTGVGFDPSVKPNDGRKHIGVESVMQRIRTLCGGDMTLTSAPGQGTTVVITIPEGKQ